jgi:hypothetical protein
MCPARDIGQKLLAVDDGTAKAESEKLTTRERDLTATTAAIARWR